DSALALRQAWELATQREDAWLHVVHVVSKPALTPRDVRYRVVDQKLTELPDKVRNHAIREAQAAQLPPLHNPLGVHVRLGAPAEAILQLAADLDASMVVVGSHGKTGFRKWVLGSVSQSLVKSGLLPVLVSRPRQLASMATSEQLEPPCPDCVAVRRESDGTEWWCEMHARERPPTHVYSHTQRVSFSKPPMDTQGALWR